MGQEDRFHFDDLFCIMFVFRFSHPTLWPPLFAVWIIMCIWRGSWSCDWLKCFLSLINILWISNFDIVSGFIMGELAPALDCFRGGWICTIAFLPFPSRHSFFVFVFSYKMEQRVTATLGLDRDPFTWRPTPIMSDFLFKWIFIYFSGSNLCEMTACRPFHLITLPSPSLAFLSL